MKVHSYGVDLHINEIILWIYFTFQQPNPQYTYSYQVADDREQTYMAHQESRDNDLVKGEYSYVDANGALGMVLYNCQW